MTRLSIIVAKAENNVIGKDNALPWRLPEDLAHFKRMTTGHPIVMGRKTFESIGKPLPNRRNIVVSANPEWSAPGVEIADSLDAALALCAADDEAFVIGGALLFACVLPLADRIIATELRRPYDGDVLFPAIPNVFREVSRERHTAASDADIRFDFVVYERAASPDARVTASAASEVGDTRRLA